MSKIPFKSLFSGYEKPIYRREDGGEINTGVKFFERTMSGTVTTAKKKILTSSPVRFFATIARLISYTSTRGYSALFLSYGLLSMAIGLGKAYFGATEYPITLSLIVGAVLSLISIPLLLVDKPFCIALQDFALTDYVFFEFFSIKRMHRQTKERGIPILVMVVIGILLAGLGVFFNFDQVVAVILSVIIIYLSFVSPEFAFFSTIIILPVLPILEHGMFVLGAMIGAAYISFMRKVIFGKRVYSIEQYDLVIALFMLCILISGIFMKGFESFESSLWMMLLALGYPLASNLIANRRLADCALGAILLSFVFPCLYTIYDVVTVIIKSGVSALSDYPVSATFETSGAFATYLLPVIITALYFISVSRKKPIRVLYIAAFIASLVCLALTARFDVIAALIAALVAYIFLKRSANLAPLASLAALLPLLILLIPARSFDLFMSAIGSGYTKVELLELWRGSVAMFVDNIFTGVGIGSDSFINEIVGYGPVIATDSSNLWLEIGCEAGIVALICLFILMLIRVMHRATYRVYTLDSQVSTLSMTAGVITIALLAFGMTEYIWADNTMYYLFWCIFGVGSASLRISKHEHDDRVMYYGDLTSVDSSVMDVRLR